MAEKNILEIFEGSEIDQSAKERVLAYARAGTGKTRFVLSIPESWGRIAYYAADNNSWLLRSIAKSKRDRIRIFRPKGPDAGAQFMEFCRMDHDDVGTIVVDTYTKVALDSVAYSANTLAVNREQHYIIGELGKGGVSIPNRGDYQGVDALSQSYLKLLFERHTDKHIIFVMHEESKQIGGPNGVIVGGPQHPGWTMIDYLPSQFATVVRLVRDTILRPGADDVEAVVVAITEYDGKFPAKIRTDDEEAPNPLARRVLDRNPASWWAEYVDYEEGRLAQPAPKKKTKKGA